MTSNWGDQKAERRLLRTSSEDGMFLHEELFCEVLLAAAKHKQSVEGGKKLWVIELFAGQAGSGSVARDLGYGYVPVDMCTDHFPADFPSPLDVSSLRGG